MSAPAIFIPPEKEHLEQCGYTDHEIDALTQCRRIMSSMGSAGQRRRLGRKFVCQLWPDIYERIRKTHWIEVKDPSTGNVVGLRLLEHNYAQRLLIDRIEERRRKKLPLRFNILKARQLGFSTFVQSYFYELLNVFPSRSSMTMSYDEGSTTELFQKARTVHNGLWFPQETKRDRGELIHFDNNSRFLTATAGKKHAGRSFTLHFLHVSEMPMWVDARTVLTGLLQAVPDSLESIVFNESTARGMANAFAEMWAKSVKGQSDYEPFFVPWFADQTYTLPFRSRAAEQAFARQRMSHEDWQYKKNHGLTMEQMHWRRAKIENNLNGSEAMFRQEFPATAVEAFISSGSPAFNLDAVEALRANVRKPAWMGYIELQTAG